MRFPSFPPHERHSTADAGHGPQKSIRPALERAGITGKVIGWHSFRHSLATNLRSLGVDVKVAQELLRHANSRTAMDLYTQAVTADKRSASQRQVEMLA